MAKNYFTVSKSKKCSAYPERVDISQLKKLLVNKKHFLLLYARNA